MIPRIKITKPEGDMQSKSSVVLVHGGVGGRIELEQGDSVDAKEWPLRHSSPAQVCGPHMISLRVV